MAAYAAQHDLRGLMEELSQSLLLHMPQDPRAFLAAELGAARRRPLPTELADYGEDAGALPLPHGTFALRLHAAVDCGGGAGTSVSVHRVLSKLSSGNRARAQAERDVAEQVHALLWKNSDTAQHRTGEEAEGRHQQQMIKELEEILAEAKRLALSLREQEFKEFDTNGDGALSLDELLQGLRGHYSQDEIQDMFTALDADVNGEISLDQYLRYWQHDGRRNCHEVEMLVQGLKPFRDIASKLPRGSDDPI